MNKILITVSVIAVAALIVAGLALVRPVNVKVELPTSELGALSGPDVIFPMRFHKTITWNQPVLATSTSGTATTLKASDMNSYGTIDLMSNVAAFTYTLPATSTMLGFLPNDGDTREWIFHNATSTAVTLTIVKGTGMYLVGDSANDDIIDNDEYAVLTCWNAYYRTALNVDIVCAIRELNDAD